MRNKPDSNKPGFRKHLLLVFICCALILSAVGVTIILAGYYKAVRPVSWLPEIQLNVIDRGFDDSETRELGNIHYRLIVDINGNIMVRNVEGESILSDFLYYVFHDGAAEKIGLRNISVNQTSDTTIFITGRGLSDTDIEISLTVPATKPRLDVNVVTRYSKQTKVNREALVALFDVPVSEVYKKNRQTDTGPFKSEYWLDRQGVRFGHSDRSALVYHTPGISSIQLDSEKNRLFLNLDYYADHPHVHILFQEDEGGRWEDQSMAYYDSGSERHNCFSIYFGNLPENIPRFMLVPHGHLAGYIFTEHADGGTIKTHRAAYFGSDTVTDIRYATGGFAGNRIPVTKSVFYADREQSCYSSIKDDPEYPDFLDFLSQLHRTGIYEICLHTPANHSSSRSKLEESIKFMKDTFNTVTWIDHGMFGGKINRECFVADGLYPGTEGYAADLWMKYNTLYFWNTAVEKIHTESAKEYIRSFKLLKASESLWRKWFSPDELSAKNFLSLSADFLKRNSYRGHLNSLMPVRGETFPTPLYWQHPTRTDDFYSWVTDYVYMHKNWWTGKADDHYLMEKEYLDRLLENRGVFINHGYYVRTNNYSDLIRERDGKMMLSPHFEKILRYMSSIRDNGDLYITTIRDIMEYFILKEKIEFDYLPCGEIIVHNKNDKPVRGLALAVRTGGILVGDKVPESRKDNGETIFWFDMEAGEQVVLSVVP